MNSKKSSVVLALVLFGSVVIFDVAKANDENTISNLEPKEKWRGWSTYGGGINNGEPHLHNNTYILNCRYMEWRLKWEYTKDDSVPTTFYFEIINPDTNETMYKYDNNENPNKTQGTTGTLKQIGDYPLFIETNSKRHLFTIEHNIKSIPEFSFEFVLVFFVSAGLTIALVRKKLK